MRVKYNGFTPAGQYQHWLNGEPACFITRVGRHVWLVRPVEMGASPARSDAVYFYPKSLY